jgi:hypothetical protein
LFRLFDELLTKSPSYVLYLARDERADDEDNTLLSKDFQVCLRNTRMFILTFFLFFVLFGLKIQPTVVDSASLTCRRIAMLGQKKC